MPANRAKLGVRIFVPYRVRLRSVRADRPRPEAQPSALYALQVFAPVAAGDNRCHLAAKTVQVMER